MAKKGGDSKSSDKSAGGNKPGGKGKGSAKAEGDGKDGKAKGAQLINVRHILVSSEFAGEFDLLVSTLLFGK